MFNVLSPFDIALGAMASLMVMSVFILVFVSKARKHRKRQLNERLRRHSSFDDAASVFGTEQVSAAQLVAHTLGRMGTSLHLVDDETSMQTEQKFIRAGFNKSSAKTTFLGCRVGLFILGIVVAFIAHSTSMQNAKLHEVLLVYLLLASVGYYLPVYVLDYIIRKRQASVLASLPDALDMLVVCVESGMGFDQAIFRISEEMSNGHPVLCEELRKMLLELRAGKARTDALKSLAYRVGLQEMSNLATLIIQSDMFGTSIAQSLHIYSDTMRTQRFQRAEELAMKLPVKLLFPLVIFILPPLFMIIMGPAVIQISRVFGK